MKYNKLIESTINGLPFSCICMMNLTLNCYIISQTFKNIECDWLFYTNGYMKSFSIKETHTIIGPNCGSLFDDLTLVYPIIIK
ncbi:hypothetical protein V1477_015228 [Vespula maculifrons]|uniref:Uncharacterized protein n=1 Tax=Vespula maculifrons TaxID=7453 RepID=A0ABD2BJN8_VESMC